MSPPPLVECVCAGSRVSQVMAVTAGTTAAEECVGSACCASVGGGDAGGIWLKSISRRSEPAASSDSWLAMDSKVFVAISAP